MHIHGAQLNPNIASLYAIAAVEKAATAKQAAEVRKKLMSSTGEAEYDPEDGVIVAIGQQAEQDSQSPSEQEDPPARSAQNAGKDDTSDAPPDEPISVWG